MRRTGLSALALPVTAVVGLVWVAVGCGLSGAGATPTVTLSAAPTAAVSPTVSPTLSFEPPSGAPQPATPRPSGATAQPPDGLLGFSNSSVAGLLGSYCWDSAGQGVCADFPAFTERKGELSGFVLSDPEADLHFQLGGKSPFAAWSASYIDAAGNTASLGSGGTSFDPDAGASFTPSVEADFAPPADSGTWIVQVSVRFPEGGDAIYGWNVTVP